jgi:hypothetical protein
MQRQGSKNTDKHLARMFVLHGLRSQIKDSFENQQRIIRNSSKFRTSKGKGKVHPKTGHEGPEGE